MPPRLRPLVRPVRRASSRANGRVGALPWLTALTMAVAVVLGCAGSTEDRLSEVRALQDAGQFNESIEPLREVLARNPDLAEANYLLGVALVQTGQPSLAVWPLEKAIASDEYAVQAGLLLANTFLGLQAFDDAIRVASQVLEKDPTIAYALRVRAHALLGANRREDALRDTERLQEVAPNDFQSILLHATILAELGDMEKAEEAYARLESTSAESGDAGLAARGCLARASFYEDNLDDEARAEAHYRKCLEQAPNDVFTLRLVSQFFDERDRRDEATALWQQAVADQPDNMTFRSTLASRYETAGQIEEARNLLKQGVELLGTPAAWMGLAEFERRTDNPEQALAALSEAESLSPDASEQLRFLKADLLVDVGRIDEAQQIEDTLQEASFRDLLRGRILLERGEAQAALDAFESGLKRWPNNAGGRYLAGLAAREVGDFDRAISEFRESVRADAAATDASLALASLELSRGNAREAADMAETFLRMRSGTRPEGHALFVQALIAQQLYDAARRAADLMRDAGFPTQAAVARARVESAASGPDAAAQAIRDSGVDTTAAANEAALRALADALLAADHADEALDAVDRAVEANPDVASLHELRGTVLLRTGREGDARQAFEKALALDEGNARARSGLAELAYKSGDAKGAIALYDEAAAADPEDVGPAYSAAQIALATGDRVGARERLDEVVRRDPGNASARNDLAWILAQSGEDLDRALALAEMAHRIQPDSPDIADTLGFVYLQRGENDRAVEAFEKAVAGRPESQSMRYHLGLALARQGEHQRALDTLRAALEAGPFPEAEAARSELARLEQN